MLNHYWSKSYEEFVERCNRGEVIGGNKRYTDFFERPKSQMPPENGEEACGEETEMETVIRAVIWPEPFNFEVTPEEKKHSRDFSFDVNGLWAAVDWLNEEHEAGHF